MSKEIITESIVLDSGEIVNINIDYMSVERFNELFNINVNTDMSLDEFTDELEVNGLNCQYISYHSKDIVNWIVEDVEGEVQKETVKITWFLNIEGVMLATYKN